MITARQKALLDFIVMYLKTKSRAPSYDEMAIALGLKSKSGVSQLLAGLEKRGFIHRIPNISRSVKVLKTPEQIISQVDMEHEEREYLIKIPFLGKIAAGTPIEAITSGEKFINVSERFVGGGRYYALKIEGDSMKDAGILNNDIAIIKETDYANIGCIVVALIYEEECTLKYWYKDEQGKVILKSANKDYEDIIIEPEMFRIQGVLQALIRRY